MQKKIVELEQAKANAPTTTTTVTTTTANPGRRRPGCSHL